MEDIKELAIVITEAIKIAKEEAERRAKQAPDCEKLKAFAKLLDSIEIPEINDVELRKIISFSKKKLTKISNYIRENI